MIQHVRIAKHVEPVRPDPAKRNLGLGNHETDKEQVEGQKARHQQVGGRRGLDEVGAERGERNAGCDGRGCWGRACTKSTQRQIRNLLPENSF